jgi:hypothetical protein
LAPAGRIAPRHRQKQLTSIFCLDFDICIKRRRTGFFKRIEAQQSTIVHRFNILFSSRGDSFHLETSLHPDYFASLAIMFSTVAIGAALFDYAATIVSR